MAAPAFRLHGLDLISLWRLIKSGSMSAKIDSIGAFELSASELKMDIENPKVWYDIFQLMAPALRKQFDRKVPAPAPKRQQFFPFQLINSYKKRLMKTVRAMPTADLLLSFVELIRSLAAQLHTERKTVEVSYYGIKVFKLGYNAAGFVPTLVGVKHIEVVDYVKMLEFLNDLALETNFFRSTDAER